MPFHDNKIYDPLDRLKELLPEASEEDHYFAPVEEETPMDEYGEPMIALPKFEDEDLFRIGPESHTPQMPRSFAVAEKKNVFGSRAWDALFQAAQAANIKGTAEALELQRFKEEAEQKRVEAEQPKDSFQELYKLLEETPQEASHRIKRMRDRKRRMLAIRSALEAQWMTAHGRVRPLWSGASASQYLVLLCRSVGVTGIKSLGRFRIRKQLPLINVLFAVSDE